MSLLPASISASARSRPSVANAFVSKFMLDVAVLDAKLYEQFERAGDHLAKLEHIRASLAHQAENPIPRDDFVDHARLELEEIERSMRKLYTICTGRSELKHRIR